MEYLNSLYLPGALAMWCALLFALTSVWGYSLVLRGDGGALRFARRAYNCYALSIILAAAVLGFALMTRDFRIEYVYQYSGLELPAHYQLAAFWAGQKGSFLIWLFWAVLLGLPLYRSAGKRQEPTVMIVYLLTTLGLLFILVRESPFVMLAETPTDGKGLNPLLQDDWMVIHPPIMFIGYASGAIPFAFAMAALWRKDSEGWARRAFPWALGGFMVLGLAILMGGYWAYKTLGWGGFWGWDPVENASLIPWLFGTILIHGLHLERTRNRYRRANYVLASLVFLSVLYGTFLTRSGVLADFSVHSFVDLGISGWLVGMMAVFGVGAAVLLATRLRSVETRENEDPLVSRGTAMVLGTITVLLAAIVVTFGTSAPLLTSFMENPGQVGPEWYNRVNLPIAIVIGMLLAAVPYLTWRSETSLPALCKKLLPSAVFATLVTGLAVAVAFRESFFPPSAGWFFSREAVFPFYLFFAYVFFAALALAANVHKTVDKARLQGLKAAGGYLSHVGVGIMLLGFIGSGGFDHSTKVSLQLDQPRQVGERTLTFVGFLEKTSPRDKDTLVIDVETADGDTFRSYPRFFRNERSGQLMMNPHVRTTPLADFYVSPLQYDPGEAPGAGKLVELSQGQSLDVGDYTVRFADFDLSAGGGNFMTEMASGRDVTLGVRLEVTGPEGVSGQAVPLYRILQARGMVETPPTPLPAGGTVRVAGLSPRDGMVRLALEGVPGLSAEGSPPTLSVDVTEKPLIQLVWFGLYVILAGGGLAIFNRLKQALRPVAVSPGPAEEA
jgi:cytochrome c-type biogenesis protein CcmF